MQTFVLKSLDRTFVRVLLLTCKQTNVLKFMFDINVRYEMKQIMIMVGMCLTVLFGYHMTNPAVQINPHAVREVKVQAGDTMWDIAARTAHTDMDVREVVYAMKELNKIDDSGTLVPGTVLKVPTNLKDSPVRALDYVAQN